MCTLWCITWDRLANRDPYRGKLNHLEDIWISDHQHSAKTRVNITVSSRQCTILLKKLSLTIYSNHELTSFFSTVTNLSLGVLLWRLINIWRSIKLTSPIHQATTVIESHCESWTWKDERERRITLPALLKLPFQLTRKMLYRVQSKNHIKPQWSGPTVAKMKWILPICCIRGEKKTTRLFCFYYILGTSKQREGDEKQRLSASIFIFIQKDIFLVLS